MRSPSAPPSHNTARRDTKRTRRRGYIPNYRPQPKTLNLLADIDAVLREYREH